jgi:hypothetical protein
LKILEGTATNCKTHLESQHIGILGELRASGGKRHKSGAKEKEGPLHLSIRRGGSVVDQMTAHQRKPLQEKERKRLFHSVAMNLAAAGIAPHALKSGAIQAIVDSACVASFGRVGPALPSVSSVYAYSRAGIQSCKALIGDQFMRALGDARDAARFSITSDVMTLRENAYNCIMASIIHPVTFSHLHFVLSIYPIAGASHTAQVVGGSMKDVLVGISPRCMEALLSSSTDSASAATKASRVLGAKYANTCVAHLFANGMKQILKTPSIKKAYTEIVGSLQSISLSPKRAQAYLVVVQEKKAALAAAKDAEVEIVVQPGAAGDELADAARVNLFGGAGGQAPWAADFDAADAAGDFSVDEDERVPDENSQERIDADIQKEAGLRIKTPAKVRFGYIYESLSSALANKDEINAAIAKVPASAQPDRSEEGGAPARTSQRIKPIREGVVEIAKLMMCMLKPLKIGIKQTEGFVSAGEALFRFREAVTSLKTMEWPNTASDDAVAAANSARAAIVTYLETSPWGNKKSNARNRKRTGVAPASHLIAAALDPRITIHAGALDLTGDEKEALDAAVLEAMHDEWQRSHPRPSAASGLDGEDAEHDEETIDAAVAAHLRQCDKYKDAVAKQNLLKKMRVPDEKLVKAADDLVLSIRTKARASFRAGPRAGRDSILSTGFKAELARYQTTVGSSAHMLSHSICFGTPFSVALTWWAERREQDFPNLARVAAAYLAVPGATADVESIWSMFKCLNTNIRSSMLPETAAGMSLVYARSDLIPQLIKNGPSKTVK